jgi:protein ImuA
MPIACTFKKHVAALHEIVAHPGHGSSAIGLGLALAGETLASAQDELALLWVREAAAKAETGEAYGPGLMSFGISPDGLIIVETRTHIDALRAALEGARCAALSAVVLETRNAVDLTASRRLKLASEKSGVAVVLIPLTNGNVPNAAQVRWRVSAALQTAAPANRSLTAFQVEVLKHPAGLIGKTCIMEWDHERHSFTKAISLPLAAIPDIGSLAP